MKNTPIQRWYLPGVPEDFEVYIKRGDLSGCALSGNKVIINRQKMVSHRLKPPMSQGEHVKSRRQNRPNLRQVSQTF